MTESKNYELQKCFKIQIYFWTKAMNSRKAQRTKHIQKQCNKFNTRVRTFYCHANFKKKLQCHCAKIENLLFEYQLIVLFTFYFIFSMFALEYNDHFDNT